MAATALAIFHSKSDQSGARCVGDASSAARVSVILRSAPGRVVVGTALRDSFIRAPLPGGRRLVRPRAILDFADQQVAPALIEGAFRASAVAARVCACRRVQCLE